MKPRSLIVCVLLCAISLPAFAGERVFQLDPMHSGVGFKIRHIYTTITGRFNKFTGTIRGDMEKPETLKVEAEVDVSSIDTAVQPRDAHLRSSDFFSVTNFPTATFKSTGVQVLSKTEGVVIGDLTICGITQSVSFKGTFNGYGAGSKGEHRAGFHAEATIDRSIFGIKYNANLPSGITALGTEVVLVLDIEAIEVDPAAKRETSTTEQNETK